MIDFNTLARPVATAMAALVTSSLCLFAAAGPVKAESAPRVEVAYADLDLGTADGRATLDGRIRRAAGMVCASGASGAAAHRAELICMRAAIDAAAPRRFAAIASAAPQS